MKYLILILLCYSCSKETETPSDEVIITSNRCFVKYSIYRVTDNDLDSLQFILNDILDCEYENERQHFLTPGYYFINAESVFKQINVTLEKTKKRKVISLDF